VAAELERLAALVRVAVGTLELHQAAAPPARRSSVLFPSRPS